MDHWQDKKVVIMGLGVQGGGVGAAQYFAHHGAKVTVTDLKTPDALADSVAKLADDHVSLRLGGHDERDFQDVDLIVKGPSIRWDHPLITLSMSRGIPVIMETSYFARHTGARLIGVTGTRGKSTTATWIYQILRRHYTSGSVYLAGNIPDTCALSLLDTATDRDIVVLELSSWQLSGFHRERVSPGIAVFTNIYEDHLNYYADMHSYIRDKTALFAYQHTGDLLITTSATLDTLRTYDLPMHQKIICVSHDTLPREVTHPRGVHNTLNKALAFETARRVLTEVPATEIIETLQTLDSIPFRQEIVYDDGHFGIVNDATSSTPIATMTALRTFTDRARILILGGNSKNLSTHDLIDLIRQLKDTIASVILLKGSMTDEILHDLQKIDTLRISAVYDDFDAAVEEAMRQMRGMHYPVYVLFSPGATSFAQFRNEFERGRRFAQITSAIMKQ